MAGVIVGSVISAGAGLIGSANSAKASRQASEAQREAAEQANVIAANAAENQIATLRDGLNRGILTQQQYLDKQNEIISGISEEQKTLLADRLKFAEGIYTQQRNDYQPYRESGTQATNQLNTLLGMGGNTGAADYGKYKTAEFTPEMFSAGVDPGYAFRLSEGLKGIDRQAAARGGLISGNALKAASGFAGDQASQEFQNAYNRYQTSRANTLSPFASLSSQGLNAASLTSQAGAQYGAAGQQAYGDYGTSLNNRQASSLGSLGAASQGISGMYGNYGNASATAYGNYATNATNALTGGANAQASGIVGGANAFNQGLSGISNLANTYYVNSLLQGRNNGVSYPTSAYEGSNPYGYGSMSGGGSPNF